MKTLIIIPFIICILSIKSMASQTALGDSTHSEIKPRGTGAAQRAARSDAAAFKLPQDVLKKVKAKQIPSTSDYFKPTAISTPNQIMLTDSAYVKSYRYYAFHLAKTRLAHPARTAFIIAGSVVIGVGIIVLAVAEAGKY